MTQPDGPVDGVGYRKHGGIAYIVLDRPERGNALTPEMRHRLGDVWEDVRDDPAVRVAIVTGSGERHFCTGADMTARSESAEGTQAVLVGPPMEEELRFTARQVKVWKPVICCVNGTAAGAGLHFVVDADIVLAAEGTSFVDTHVNVGQVGAIENIGLAKRLPLGTVLRMTLMGKAYRLTAERAHHFGLVDEVVPRGELIRTAEEMARAMMQGSPRTSALSQEAIWKSLETGYHEAMDFGWALVRMHWAHPDATEGPTAFAERREPKWQ
jgi:E-phenylitaconyl-CoA hydratase